jgi:hypothetical protein
MHNVLNIRIADSHPLTTPGQVRNRQGFTGPRNVGLSKTKIFKSLRKTCRRKNLGRLSPRGIITGQRKADSESQNLEVAMQPFVDNTRASA